MTVRKVEIIADRAAKTFGAIPFPQAIKIGEYIYTSMILPINPEGTAIMGKDSGNQIKQCITNLSMILDTAAAAMTQIIKLNVYLTNLDDIKYVDSVLKDEFTAAPPTRTVLGVAQLPYKVLVAIDAIVYVPATSSGKGTSLI